MKPERWVRIKELFHAVLDRPEDQRDAFLEGACAGDEALRQEVKSLLAHDELAEGFLEEPPAVVAAMLGQDQGRLTEGQVISHYKTQSLLGVGGMGEVYKAVDTRLNRTVAIKVLRHHISNQADARARFKREAETIATLNHPHICVLHDIGQDQGIDYLVMEYLEGQSLSKRIEKGALPLDEALKIAIQIADALDKAHRQGVVHRDLKPGNIMLTKSGAKLLDFGLAKLKSAPGAPDHLSNLPTQASVTAQGAILGTLQFMAPEQLEGKDADARTDIFAFGAILYEMLTGRKAFLGQSQVSLIAAILEREPAPISSLQAMTPPVLDRLVRKCLAKDPDARWQTALDLLDELKWISEGGGQAAAAPFPVRRRTREIVAWSLLGVAVIAAVIMGLAWIRQPRGNETQTMRFTIDPPPGITKNPGPAAPRYAISADGRYLAFTVGDLDGTNHLWVRAMDSPTSLMIQGSEDATFPFWSPDNQSLGFFTGGKLDTEGKLKRIDLPSGRPQTILAAVTNVEGSTWGRSGILFAAGPARVIYSVPATGGQPAPVTKLDESRGEITHTWPYFLPDGRHFLYLARSSKPENSALFVGSLDSPEVKLLLKNSERAVYSPPGYLLYTRSAVLFAHPFDPRSLGLQGEPVKIVEQVASSSGNGRAAFTVSDNGILVYRSGTQPGTGASLSELQWLDRDGKKISSVGEPRLYGALALSPDANKLLVAHIDPDGNTRTIWLHDLVANTSTRLTAPVTAGVAGIGMAWSPDSRRIVLASNPDPNTLFQRLSSGVGEAEPLLTSDGKVYPSDWSSDGRLILFTKTDPKTDKDEIWILPLSGDRIPTLIVGTKFNNSNGRFSPDMKWIAYTSDESGRSEVYVQPFPGPGPKSKVSINGGEQPRWQHDGRELYYLSADSRLMTVGRKTTASFEPAPPRDLFETQIRLKGKSFDVTSDGQRFLIRTTLEEDTHAPIHVVVNWPVLLHKKIAE